MTSTETGAMPVLDERNRIADLLGAVPGTELTGRGYGFLDGGVGDISYIIGGREFEVSVRELVAEEECDVCGNAHTNDVCGSEGCTCNC
jgi:hypothetical protein